MIDGTITVYPNPVRDKFILGIVGEIESVSDIELIDSQGRMHSVNASWLPSVNGLEVDMTNLSHGLYLIKLNVNNEDRILRIIKE